MNHRKDRIYRYACMLYPKECCSGRLVGVEDVTSADRLASWHWRRPLAAILSLAVVEACDACTWLAKWNWMELVWPDW